MPVYRRKPTKRPGVGAKRRRTHSDDVREGYANHARAADGAIRAGSFVQAVRSAMKANAETKYKTLYSTESTAYGTTLTSPANFTYLNALSEGYTENTRVGNVVSPTFLNVRGSVKTNTRVPCYTKLFVLEMDQSADPRVDLLENNAGVLAPASLDLEAIWQRINVAKYKVLCTKTIKTGSYGANDDDYGCAEMYNLNIPLGGKMEYQDGGTLPGKRTIAFFAISRQGDNDTTTGHTVEVTYNSKFYYKDL